ncbi:MAG: hypothetical protein HFG57_11695 [Lachnospiraceae bacterium]|nr:hypothetical protein [Lachnospiraceae bacterium]MCI9106587.1 hypothetical protein [Lachnospiraceae bacterium]
MKKMKISALLLLVLMTVCGVTACGNNNDTTSGSSTSQTNQTSSAASTESSGSTGISESSANGSRATSGSGEESSTGVIGGLIDDVEQGVEDLTGNDASRASDESK